MRQSHDAKSVRSSGSANEGFLVTAGPCCNYTELVALQQFNEMKHLANIQTAEDIDACMKKVKSIVQHWDELIASCKTATAELKRATTSATRNQEGRKEALSNARGKAKASAAKRKKEDASAFQILDMMKYFEFCEVDAGAVMHPQHDMSHPWLFAWRDEEHLEFPCALLKLVSLPDGNAPQLDETQDKILMAVQKEVEAFEQTFRKSDLRVVAGKGQQPCGELTSEFVRTGDCLKLEGSCRLRPLSYMSSYNFFAWAYEACLSEANNPNVRLCSLFTLRGF